MSIERWEEIEALFHAAQDRPEDERATFVQAACVGDEALRRVVQSLLAQPGTGAGFLSQPALAIAAQISSALAVQIAGESQLSARAASEVSFVIGRQIGPYRIQALIGAGGMGVVYAAHDERLNRRVAIKTIRKEAGDSRARERLRREARAAASLNHPNICQLYDIGEEDGVLFLAMELLDGRSLAARLLEGPLACGEAVQIMLATLTALDALHRQGLVHRDLKPSNVFLTAHGVKLLDFGLARSMATDVDASETALTVPGGIVGTPNYMAPEQVRGVATDARTDLFAAGCVLFEMLSGKPPFARDSAVDVFHAITSKEPPRLGGSPAIEAVDRIVHRVLSKDPRDRFQTAEDMAHALREVLLAADTGVARTARVTTRLMVLPFRVLRSDAETDFLAFSLPDAVTSSLSRLDSLILRSSIVASRFAKESPDLKAIAREAEVDVVLTGTMVRAGDQLRVTTQLVEAPGGALIASHKTQSSLGDLFTLEEDLASQIVEALTLPLTVREHRLLKQDVPASAKAYEFYLRANQLTWYNPQLNYAVARDLYMECVQLDPRYAPAWARLGRVQRLLGKFADSGSEECMTRAETAFKRALEINPDLALAHHQYARLEIDLGRAQDAMVRLLGRAHRHKNDSELFVALVQACRYCGLLEASLAAHELARKIDPLAPTSVAHTYFMAGDYRHAIEHGHDALTRAVILIMLRRSQDAVRALQEITEQFRPGRQSESSILQKWCEGLRLIAEGRLVEALDVSRALTNPAYHDPESLFYTARQFAYLGETDTALKLLERSVDEGFFCCGPLTGDPWLEGLRSHPTFAALVQHATTRQRQAVAAFMEAGGAQLLGVTETC
ncbi:MAG TPA: protein kinase [Vicinamibacterales bacterium]|nr:protein kinase [Vicinamibacterales bacterium]